MGKNLNSEKLCPRYPKPTPLEHPIPYLKAALEKVSLSLLQKKPTKNNKLIHQTFKSLMIIALKLTIYLLQILLFAFLKQSKHNLLTHVLIFLLSFILHHKHISSVISSLDMSFCLVLKTENNYALTCNGPF